jgi:hypothetical protein
MAQNAEVQVVDCQEEFPAFVPHFWFSHRCGFDTGSKNTCIATAAGVQSPLIAMRKLLYLDAVAILFLLAGGLYVSGPIVVDREAEFYDGLDNSLYYLDQAKSDWAEKEHKAENDVPTMTELLPYMGKHRGLIDKFTALGVRYTITPFGEEHNQSDTATLTEGAFQFFGF